MTAFNEPKARGVVASAVGKVYYVATKTAHILNILNKVFVLFDNLTAYKEVLFDTLKSKLKGCTEFLQLRFDQPLLVSLITITAGELHKLLSKKFTNIIIHRFSYRINYL